MEKNNFYDALEDLGYVFNPKIVYEGSYFLYSGNFNKIFNYDINKDIFYINSDKKNGINSYKDFVDRYFYCILPKNNDMNTINLVPLLISDLSEDGKSRFIKFNYTVTLLNILKSSEIDTFEEDIPVEEKELCDYVYNTLKKTRNKLLNVIRLGKESDYYVEIKKLFDNIKVSFNNNVLQGEADRLTSLIFIVKNIKNVIEENVFDLYDFKKCFDKDKLFLILAKVIVEDSLYTEISEQRLNNSFIEVVQYVNLVKEMKLNNYNPSISYYDDNLKKVRKYTFDDLKKEVSEILSRHPEFKFIQISNEEAKKQNLIGNVDNAKAFAEKLAAREEAIGTFLANWEFVRKGTVDKEEKKFTTVSKNTSINRTFNNKSERDYYEELLAKRDLFESTSYVYRIIGVDKFEGYVGYIYSNGIVVFEKMFEDKVQNIPAKGNNAIYIMTIENFIDFSKKTKIEIIEYIKNTNNPNVWRLYHNVTLKKRLMKFINGIYYSKEVEEAIDKLLEEKIISKKLENKKD